MILRIHLTNICELPTSQAHQDEIAALEAQMGNASTYAAAGLKRRLQTLKAWRNGAFHVC